FMRQSRRGLLYAFQPSIAAMIAKDLRYVVRDNVLLSQLGMPAILFFVPAVLSVQQRGAFTRIGPGDMYPFAIGMTGVILFMQTSILSLSSVGLEGRAFWLALTSPNNGR